MTTIHDEEKIKKLIESCRNDEDGYGLPIFDDYQLEILELTLRQYGEHIRLKTIDEAMFYVNKYHDLAVYGNDDEIDPVYERAFEEIITNLEQLKK